LLSSVVVRRAVALLAFALLVVSGCAGLGEDSVTVPLVRPADRVAAPAVTVPALDGGKPVTLAAFRGHPVLLNFWASWCEPCTKEMPTLVTFAKEHPGLDVVGLAVNDRPGDSRRFARKVGADFTLGIDRDADVAAEFDATTGLPTTVIIDQEGRIASTVFGPVSRTALEGFADQLGV
jgi:thiol-disulfide isomerase/thioredoxin